MVNDAQPQINASTNHAASAILNAPWVDLLWENRQLGPCCASYEAAKHVEESKASETSIRLYVFMDFAVIAWENRIFHSLWVSVAQSHWGSDCRDSTAPIEACVDA
jgi:hypothetical protein